MTSAAQLALEVERAGGTLELRGDGRISYEIPKGAEHLLPLLREHKAKIITLLRLRNSWPPPLSYPEYFCRMRAAGLVACSREEWEAEHGSDAEGMARYARLGRQGAKGESSTTMTDGRHETAFPACPKCGSYALHRENGTYECLTCGLTGILEADARNAGARKDQLRQEAPA